LKFVTENEKKSLYCVADEAEKVEVANGRRDTEETVKAQL